MKLFSKESIIFYSILGAVTGFVIAPFIRSLMDLSTPLELIITTAVIIPMYIVAKRVLVKFIIKQLRFSKRIWQLESISVCNFV